MCWMCWPVEMKLKSKLQIIKNAINSLIIISELMAIFKFINCGVNLNPNQSTPCYH